ncbi:MAG: helix-turn-helix domain-containing protein [Anaerolineales bacterium]|nr:helix-turn-helix domain-containing protein [Anaerolineales bacterium]
MSDYTLPTQFDRLIHQPSRLAIMAVLYGCESAEFAYLLDATGLTKGTLSAHLSKLEEAGYVEIQKTFKGKYPHTSASLTKDGRKAFKKYRKQYRDFERAMDQG